MSVVEEEKGPRYFYFESRTTRKCEAQRMSPHCIKRIPQQPKLDGALRFDPMDDPTTIHTQYRHVTVSDDSRETKFVSDFLVPALEERKYGSFLKWDNEIEGRFSVRWCDDREEEWFYEDIRAYQDFNYHHGKLIRRAEDYLIWIKKKFRSLLYDSERKGLVRRVPSDKYRVKSFEILSEEPDDCDGSSRFVSPKFIGKFLVPALDEGKYGNLLRWVDRVSGHFAIGWCNKRNQKWTEKNCLVFTDWDKFQGRYAPHEKDYLPSSKGRFRSLLGKFQKTGRITPMTSPCSYEKHFRICRSKKRFTVIHSKGRYLGDSVFLVSDEIMEKYNEDEISAAICLTKMRNGQFFARFPTTDPNQLNFEVYSDAFPKPTGHFIMHPYSKVFK